MQGAVAKGWLVGLALVATLSFTMSAQFQAPSPRAFLQPVGQAAEQIRLTQGDHSILWTSLGTTVEGYRAQGWPSMDGIEELGGAVQLEKVTGDTGVIGFGEPPMLLEFSIGD